MHRELPVTSIYVTHDQVEAMTLGDRLCVMSGGEVQQIGTTDDLAMPPEPTYFFDSETGLAQRTRERISL